MSLFTEYPGRDPRQSVRKHILTLNGEDTCIVDTEKFGEMTTEPHDEEIRHEIDISNVPEFDVNRKTICVFTTDYGFPGTQRGNASEYEYGEDAEYYQAVFLGKAELIACVFNIHRIFGEIPYIQDAIVHRETGIAEIIVV